MKIAAAQTRPIAGDVRANLEVHVEWIARAASHGASVVVFPELSLTGYHSTLAKELATNQEDPRFEILQTLSDRHDLTIAAGMPIRSDDGTRIGMIVFQPNEARQTYAKQLLHEDELPSFVPGDRDLVLTRGPHVLAPAICYESLQSKHAAKAATSGATVYLTSVAKSAGGVARAGKHYPEVAKAHGMVVVMSNCIGPCDDFLSAGGSAAWNREGARLGQLGETDEGMLIVDVETSEITIL